MSRHSNFWLKIDVRPQDYDPNVDNQGDCTTRAMAYCLAGKMTYREIEAKQYQIAAKKKAEEFVQVRRNTRGVWDQVMFNYGWTWLHLSCKLPRWQVAVILKACKSPIITLSSGHVAVVDDGNVVDTWDSCGGRVQNLLLPSSVVDEVTSLMRGQGIEITTGCKVIRKRRRW